ncbi:MAG: peptidase [Actinobacteria bacterium]|nr:peptidase [Actinomycetota bacterium]
MSEFGRLALVGSGEYLPVMAELESSLIQSGPSLRYVQLATAAGQESDERLRYWERIGKEQADRIGAQQVFLPVFTREDAMRMDFAEKIRGAGLIYLSGGDPHYLAQTLFDTPVWEAIIASWKSGTSLAGCSAGAMAFGPDIPHFRKMKESGEIGLGLLPNIRVVPHYNKFFKWIPESAVQLFLKAPEGVRIVGIDEGTAIVTNNLKVWSIYGDGFAHLLNGKNTGKYESGSEVKI